MITLTMLCDHDDPVGFHVTGHAECGAYGEDLVCAAVSAIVQTAILGITDVLELESGISVEDGDAYCIIDQNAPQLKKDQASVIFRTMETGIRSIQSSHPGTLKIRNKEV